MLGEKVEPCTIIGDFQALGVLNSCKENFNSFMFNCFSINIIQLGFLENVYFLLSCCFLAFTCLPKLKKGVKNVILPVQISFAFNPHSAGSTLDVKN